MPTIGRVTGYVDIDTKDAERQFRAIARETRDFERRLAATNVEINRFEGIVRRGGRGANVAADNVRVLRRHADELRSTLRENAAATNQFDRELRKINGSARRARNSTRLLRNSFRQLRGVLVALGGGVTTSLFVRLGRAIGDMAEEVAISTKDLVAMSATLNASSREVEVFLNQLRLFGIEGSQINTFFGTFARKLEEARSGSGAAYRAYTRLGVTLEQLREATPVAAFDLLAEGAQRAGIRGAELAKILSEVGENRSGRHLAPALSASAEAWRAARAEAEKYTTSSDELNRSVAGVREELIRVDIALEQSRRAFVANNAEAIIKATEGWKNLELQIQRTLLFILGPLFSTSKPLTQELVEGPREAHRQLIRVNAALQRIAGTDQPLTDGVIDRLVADKSITAEQAKQIRQLRSIGVELRTLARVPSWRFSEEELERLRELVGEAVPLIPNLGQRPRGGGLPVFVESTIELLDRLTPALAAANAARIKENEEIAKTNRRLQTEANRRAGVESQLAADAEAAREMGQALLDQAEAGRIAAEASRTAANHADILGRAMRRLGTIAPFDPLREAARFAPLFNELTRAANHAAAAMELLSDPALLADAANRITATADAVAVFTERLEDMVAAGEISQDVADAISRAFGGIESSASNLQGFLSTLGQEIGNAFADAVLEAERLADVLDALLDTIVRAAASAFIGAPLADFFTNLAGRRQHGGLVLPGRSYLVGERGPELLSTSRTGYVTPGSKLGGGAVVVESLVINAEDREGFRSDLMNLDGALRASLLSMVTDPKVARAVVQAAA